MPPINRFWIAIVQKTTMSTPPMNELSIVKHVTILFGLDEITRVVVDGRSDPTNDSYIERV